MLLHLGTRVPSTGSFSEVGEGFSPAESGSLSNVEHSAPLYAALPCSWDAPWYPGETRWSIRLVLLVPSWPRCYLAHPSLPEHHLNGGFWSFWALLQAPCWVSVATKRVTIPVLPFCPLGLPQGLCNLT